MRAGVGYSENVTSFDAAVEAATAALAESGAASIDLVLVTTTAKHDAARIRDGLRSVLGPDCRIFGGWSWGVITKDYLGYAGCQVGVAVLATEGRADIDMYISGPLPDRVTDVGEDLGAQIRSKAYRGTENLVLVYDFIKGPPIPGVAFNLNMASPLLAGLDKTLDVWPLTAGMGAVGDVEGTPTYQWFDDRVEQGTAMGLVLSGDVRMDTTIMHGCRPASRYHTITKAAGATIYEIDGKPAAALVGELLGADFADNWEAFPLFVTLGVNHGDKYGPVQEENYQNRLVMSVEKDSGALVMFDDDLVTGAEVQVMRRSIDFRYVDQRVDQAFAALGDRTPVLAVYFDCAGRASAICASDGEEGAQVAKAVGGRVPLLGMYTAVELAEVRGSVQGLDWTGVLCIFST